MCHLHLCEHSSILTFPIGKRLVHTQMKETGVVMTAPSVHHSVLSSGYGGIKYVYTGLSERLADQCSPLRVAVFAYRQVGAEGVGVDCASTGARES